MPRNIETTTTVHATIGEYEVLICAGRNASETYFIIHAKGEPGGLVWAALHEAKNEAGRHIFWNALDAEAVVTRALELLEKKRKNIPKIQ